MPETFSSESQNVLHDFGWPDRRADISSWVQEAESAGIHAHETARKFLEEFGGLSISSFEINPHLCAGEEDRFLEWGDEIGRSLFPVGVIESGRYFLGIDEHGEIYLVETWIASYGRMPNALDNLINGVHPVVIRE
jgi:hypothetical protein